VRNTGVAIDPSGNVWLANNWKEVPLPPNPGGYQIVAYVGVAAPVQRSAPVARPTVTSPAAPTTPIVIPRFTG
jgi:hypothetical protein